MERIALIGFGEAGQAFARGGGWGRRAAAFDIKTDDPAAASAKRADYEAAGVSGCAVLAEALEGAPLVLSVVTADQALAAAEAAAPLLSPGALYCDCNSVAPDTKRRAAALIERAGGRYVDVAVMSPVEPARLAVPLLLGGPHAGAASQALAAAGFTNVAVAGPAIGDASAIKMIRSVMIKGIEALSAECALAAEAAGVREAVIASLDASWPGADWAKRFDYNLDRMMVHGERRAAEMGEVVKTLDALGTGSAMTRGTVERQRAIGRLKIAPPHGLAAKLAALFPTLARLEKAA